MSVPVLPVRSVTLADPIAVANAIKTSIATVAGAASYSGGALNGAVGAGLLPITQTVSFTTSSHSGSYVAGSKVTFTGLDRNGLALVEQLLVTAVNGGETIVGLKGFSKVTQIDVEAQSDTAGAFTFGYSDVMCPGCWGLRVGGTTGSLKVGFADQSIDTIPSVVAGERINMMIQKVFGASTATKLTLFIGDQ